MTGRRKIILRRRWWEGASVPEVVTVYVDDDCGDVYDDRDRHVGRVKKGSRTYSPPTHKGSRVAKYHRQVPEWHGWTPDHLLSARPNVHKDSRIDALRELLERADRR